MQDMEITASSTPPAQKAYLKIKRIVQTRLDATVIFPTQRWAFFAFSLLLYIVRVYFLMGFYIISYALGIYLLNLLIGFLSPAIDPDDAADDGPMLPTAGMDRSEEFRPFSRKLPEFKFWWAATRAVWLSLLLTCSSVFDLPVFWPILLMYFILLVFITMKDRAKHMMKYNYVPWTFGKQTYRDLTKVNAAGLPQSGGKNNK